MLTNIEASIKYLFSNFYFPHFSIPDVIEIAIIVYALYMIMKNLKNTRAWIFTKVFIFFFCAYIVSFACGFNVITLIFNKLISLAAIGIIVVLQPELRKAFESIGVKKLVLKRGKKDKKYKDRMSDKTITEVVEGCKILSAAKTGALIVFEKNIPLYEYINSGITIDAIITRQLLVNTFEHNTPLHDGAVIVVGDRLMAATCYLPLSGNETINKKYGTRHRAGVGMAEETDAFTVIVSEETGNISATYEGKMYEDLSPKELEKLLKEFQKTEEKVEVKSFKKRLFSNSGIKIISLIFGIIMWFGLMNVYDPITTVRFYQVPITILNEEIVDTAGQSYSTDSPMNINITVSDKRSIVENMKTSDISVYADIKKLSAINTVPLYAEIKNAPDATVDFGQNNNINITFEDVITKDFPITIETTGSVMRGHYLAETSTNADTITAFGPRSQINMVSKVAVSINVDGIDSTFNNYGTPVAYDANGKVLQKVKFSQKDVFVSGTVYNTKEVDLDIQINPQNSMEYEIKDFSFKPNKIEIAGKDEDLANVDTMTLVLDITIDPEKVSNGKYSVDVSLSSLLDKKYYPVNEDESLSITLDIIDYKPVKMSMTMDDLTILNNHQKYDIRPAEENTEFTVWVPSEWADTITIKDLEPKVDIGNIKTGSNYLKVEFVSDLVKFQDDVYMILIASKQ